MTSALGDLLTVPLVKNHLQRDLCDLQIPCSRLYESSLDLEVTYTRLHELTEFLNLSSTGFDKCDLSIF